MNFPCWPRLLLWAAVVLTSIGAQAQHVIVHVGGGLTTHYAASARQIGGLQVGAGLEVELSQTLTLEPALFYMAKGWQEPDRTVIVYDEEGLPVLDDAGDTRTSVMRVTSHTHYLVPALLLHAFIPVQRPHYVMLTAGPYVAWGVGGQTKVRGDTSQQGAARFYYAHSTFSQPGMHRLDAGLTLGVGYEFRRTLQAGIETHLGLLPVQSGSQARNLSLMLTLGYRLPL